MRCLKLSDLHELFLMSLIFRAEKNLIADNLSDGHKLLP